MPSAPARTFSFVPPTATDQPGELTWQQLSDQHALELYVNEGTISTWSRQLADDGQETIPPEVFPAATSYIVWLQWGKRNHYLWAPASVLEIEAVGDVWTGTLGP